MPQHLNSANPSHHRRFVGESQFFYALDANFARYENILIGK